MPILGIVPARKGSLRFPDKHHALLLGKPMFAYTLEAAASAKRLDRVVVSSDDPQLQGLAEHYGMEYIARPPELATATAALDDAVRHVCQLLERRDGFAADVVVTMQGNVPVRCPGQIDDVIERLERVPDATAVCTAQEMRFRPEWAKVVTDEATGAVAPFLPGAVGYRTQDFPKLFVLDGAVYGVRASTLFATAGNRAAHAWFGPRLHVLIQDDAMYSLEVDYPDQIALAEFSLRRLHEREVRP
jgi:CMP-N-acetylneuraminic acid synthetase